MVYILPDGFDPESSDFRQGDGLSDIASELGWVTWEDVIAEEETYDDMNIRPGAYVTPQDAIYAAYDVGILSFTRIIYNEVTEFWYLVVEYEDP